MKKNDTYFREVILYNDSLLKQMKGLSNFSALSFFNVRIWACLPFVFIQFFCGINVFANHATSWDTATNAYNVKTTFFALGVTGDTTICSGTAVDLVATGGTGYVWRLLDGPAGNIIDPNLSNNATYNTGILNTAMTYRVVADDGVGLDSMETTVSVFDLLTINADTSICPEELVVFTAIGGSGDFVWRQLDGPAGNIVTANLGTSNSFNTGALTTTTTYRFVDITCADSLERTVTIFAPIPLSAGLDQLVCPTTTVNLSASAGFTNYTWTTNPAGGNFSGQNISDTPSGNTEYFLVGEEVNECIARDTVEVMLYEPLTMNADTSICPEELVVFTATGGSGDYIWRELDGPTGNIVTANLSTSNSFNTGALTTTTTYRFVDITCADSLERTVTIFVPIPVAAGPNQAVCAGMSANLSASSGFTNYSWEASTGGSAGTGQNISVNPASTTSYYLTADDANGCSVMDTVKVIVLLPTNFNVTITVPQSGVDNFGVCGPDKTVTVEVENLLADTIFDIVTTFDLLNGFFYLPNSILGDAIEQNINAPSFLLDTLLPKQMTTFTVDLNVNCDGIEEANDPGDKSLDIIFSCLDGGADIFTETSPNFELAKPTLTIPSSTPTPLEMYLGKIDTVTSRIVNGSQGDLDSLEFFIVNHPELTLLDVLLNGMSIPCLLYTSPSPRD